MNIFKIIKYLVATALICIGMVLAAWLYSTPIDFGEGWVGDWTARGFITVIAICFSTGIAVFLWSKDVPPKKIKLVFIANISAFLFALWMATTFYGVKMDASYAFGINAVMISKSIIILLPVIAAVIGFITILIYKPESFWWGIMQIGVIIGITVITGVYVSPAILAAI